MPEPFSEQHLAQLEERWRRDPGSRVFLQLAEELRRGGRLERATEILRAGLVRHPTYLSAQVALGRCLAERGDHRAATEVLERAVGQDPAQLVANRLLIESYLALGDGVRARARLDFYQLFSERDDEFRRLEARVLKLESPPPSAAPAAPARPFGELPGIAAPPLAFAPAPRAARREERPFGGLTAPRSAAERLLAACRRESIFAVAAPAPLAVAAAVSAPLPAPVEEPPAPLLAEAPAASTPWWAAAPAVEAESAPAEPAELAAEDSAAPAPTPAMAPALAAAPPWREPAPELALESEATLFATSFSPREIGAEVERETIEEPFDEVYSAAAATAPVAASASVTLAELYLEQGHLEEAERTFRAVLADRPEDTTARRGLTEIAARRSRRAAAEVESAWTPEATPAEPEATAGSLSRRKAGALRAYLDRLRRGASAHVP